MRSLKALGLFLAFGLGGFLSIARIVQGGHFITDIFASALIMWYTAYFVDYLIYKAPALSKFRNACL